MEKLFLVVILISLALSLGAPASVIDNARARGGTLRAVEAKQSAEQAAQRRVEGHVLTSESFPAIRIKVNPSFKYLGRLQFNLKEMARVDRFVFVDGDKGRVKRMFMVQFEGFLEGVDHTYKYRVTNPVTLGGQTYNQNTWFFDNAQNIKQNPGAESEKTTAFLKEKHYRLDDELMMSRFVRVVDEQRRHEIIIYYVENLKDAGFSIAEYADEGPASARQTASEKALTQRSLKSFTVIE